MRFTNPYVDPFKTWLTPDMPVFDEECYTRYTQHRKVYDKLWVVKSQGLNGGPLEQLTGRENTITYPIFIKPRWGHLSAASKNCYKIKSAADLQPFIHYPHMMWSDFVDAKEGMTDYFLLHGRICHQLTYVYSEKQNGFSDDWKLISCKSTPPIKITSWVEQHLRNFTGVVNVQYRSDKIIEVGLRLARGGAYLVSTQCSPLIKNVNSLFTHETWDFSKQEQMMFDDFYVFKCFTTVPIVYLLPYYIMNTFIKQHTPEPFHEWYFEPAGGEGMVFYQFMDNDFDRGMKTKQRLEGLFSSVQIVVLVMLVIAWIILFVSDWKYKYVFAIFTLVFLSTRFINPMIANFNLYKAQRQSLIGGGPVVGPVSDDASSIVL